MAGREGPAPILVYSPIAASGCRDGASAVKCRAEAEAAVQAAQFEPEVTFAIKTRSAG